MQKDNFMCDSVLGNVSKINCQYHPTIIYLIEIGFEQKIIENKVIYKINTLNGYIYFNPTQKEYTWYHKTIIGDYSNDLNLNIETNEDLLKILKIFRIK